MLLLAVRVPTWKQKLKLVQPDTLLHWHRQGFRLFWKARSARPAAQPRMSEDTRRLIRTMATGNPLWGAERIRGELLKLGISASKRTVQKYMRQARPPHKHGQSWATFFHNHAHEIWACDFLQINDLWFRSLFAFFVIELASRTVVHGGVTRHPRDEWVAQQLRAATPFGQKPRYLVRDNDSKYGPQFTRVAATSGIAILRTPVLAPRANAILAACSESMWTTSIRPGRIRASTKRFRLQRRHRQVQARAAGKSSACQSWVVSTTTIASLHDTPNVGRCEADG